MPVLTVNRVPTSRSFRAGKWPITTATSQSGVRSKRLWGNLASGGSLSLTYANIPDDVAEDFIDSWQQTKGGLNYLETTNGNGIQSTDPMFEGMSADMKAEILSATTGTQWTYAQAPVVENVAPGISTVKVELIAELRSD
jgi:hypothetical protein